MEKDLHDKYTTSAAMLQIKRYYNLTNVELANKLMTDVELVDRWVKGVEQMKPSGYTRVIGVFPEMKNRIDYETY